MTNQTAGLPVELILYRRLTFTDWNAIHGELARDSGGGERHIALDKIITNSATSRFLGSLTSPTEMDVKSIGSAAEAQLTFKDWGGRRNQWTVADQANNRHPSISTQNGFPPHDDNNLWAGQSSSTNSADWLNRIVVYWVRCPDNGIYMGYVISDSIPDGWPTELSQMFEGVRTGIIDFRSAVSLSLLGDRVLTSISKNHNILLYGPSGTGKTYAMHELYDVLDGTAELQGINLQPIDIDNPFVVNQIDLAIPRPIYIDWITFHQSMSYEEFVIGLRPIPENVGLRLKPRAGRFIEAVRAVGEEGGSAILFIDELNRGNSAQILGELITFLEVDKRDIPFKLLGVDINEDGSQTEGILFSIGEGTLDYPVHVPENIYIVASMNSLDRSVAPLDQALARRFFKITCGPDMNLLADKLGINPGEDVAPNSITSGLIAYRLLERINKYVRHSWGPDFEFGHGYLSSVWIESDEILRLRELTVVWDTRLLPQIEELYRTRSEELIIILRADEENPPDQFPYSIEDPPADFIEAERIVYPLRRLSSLPDEDQRSTLIFLAGIEL